MPPYKQRKADVIISEFRRAGSQDARYVLCSICGDARQILVSSISAHVSSKKHIAARKSRKIVHHLEGDHVPVPVATDTSLDQDTAYLVDELSEIISSPTGTATASTLPTPPRFTSQATSQLEKRQRTSVQLAREARLQRQCASVTKSKVDQQGTVSTGNEGETRRQLSGTGASASTSSGPLDSNPDLVSVPPKKVMKSTEPSDSRKSSQPKNAFSLYAWLARPSINLVQYHDILAAEGLIDLSHLRRFAKTSYDKQERYLEKTFGATIPSVDRYFLLDALEALRNTTDATDTT